MPVRKWKGDVFIIDASVAMSGRFCRRNNLTASVAKWHGMLSRTHAQGPGVPGQKPAAKSRQLIDRHIRQQRADCMSGAVGGAEAQNILSGLEFKLALAGIVSLLQFLILRSVQFCG